nr:hypothetical protein [Candidatus Aminicenantes bacterium]
KSTHLDTLLQLFPQLKITYDKAVNSWIDSILIRGGLFQRLVSTYGPRIRYIAEKILHIDKAALGKIVRETPELREIIETAKRKSSSPLPGDISVIGSGKVPGFYSSSAVKEKEVFVLWKRLSKENINGLELGQIEQIVTTALAKNTIAKEQIIPLAYEVFRQKFYLDIGGSAEVKKIFRKLGLVEEEIRVLEQGDLSDITWLRLQILYQSIFKKFAVENLSQAQLLFVFFSILNKGKVEKWRGKAYADKSRRKLTRQEAAAGSYYDQSCLPDLKIPGKKPIREGSPLEIYYTYRTPTLEECQVLAKEAQKGNKAAVDLLVITSIKKVVNLAESESINKGKLSTIEQIDLVHEVIPYIIRAANEYKPMNVRFTTFMRYWVVPYLKSLVNKHSDNCISMPSSIAKLVRKAQSVLQEMNAEGIGENIIKELAKRMKVEIRTAAVLVDTLRNRSTVSLQEARYPQEADNPKSRQREEVIGEDFGQEYLLTEIRLSQLIEKVQEKLERKIKQRKISFRDARVFFLYSVMGLEYSEVLSSLNLGFGRQRINQIAQRVGNFINWDKLQEEYGVIVSFKNRKKKKGGQSTLTSSPLGIKEGNQNTQAFIPFRITDKIEPVSLSSPLEGDKAIIAIEKKLRPQSKGGIASETKEDLEFRGILWRHILAHSFGDLSQVVYMNKKELPLKYRDRAKLGHLVIRGKTTSTGKVALGRKIGPYNFKNYRNQEYELEVKDGMPMRIFFPGDCSLFVFFPIVDNKTGAIIDVHMGVLDTAKFTTFKDITTYTYLDIRGNFRLGGARPLADGSRSRIRSWAKFSAHPDERVKVLVKEGLVRRCTSLESDLDEEFALLFKKSVGKYSFSFWGPLQKSDLKLLGTEYQIHNYSKSYIKRRIYNFWEYAYGRRPARLVKMLNKLKEELWVVKPKFKNDELATARYFAGILGLRSLINYLSKERTPQEIKKVFIKLFSEKRDSFKKEILERLLDIKSMLLNNGLRQDISQGRVIGQIILNLNDIVEVFGLAIFTDLFDQPQKKDDSAYIVKVIRTLIDRHNNDKKDIFCPSLSTSSPIEKESQPNFYFIGLKPIEMYKLPYFRLILEDSQSGIKREFYLPKEPAEKAVQSFEGAIEGDLFEQSKRYSLEWHRHINQILTGIFEGIYLPMRAERAIEHFSTLIIEHRENETALRMYGSIAVTIPYALFRVFTEIADIPVIIRYLKTHNMPNVVNIWGIAPGLLENPSTADYGSFIFLTEEKGLAKYERILRIVIALSNIPFLLTTIPAPEDSNKKSSSALINSEGLEGLPGHYEDRIYVLDKERKSVIVLKLVSNNQVAISATGEIEGHFLPRNRNTLLWVSVRKHNRERGIATELIAAWIAQALKRNNQEELKISKIGPESSKALKPALEHINYSKYGGLKEGGSYGDVTLSPKDADLFIEYRRKRVMEKIEETKTNIHTLITSSIGVGSAEDILDWRAHRTTSSPIVDSGNFFFNGSSDKDQVIFESPLINEQIISGIMSLEMRYLNGFQIDTLFISNATFGQHVVGSLIELFHNALRCSNGQSVEFDIGILAIRRNIRAIFIQRSYKDIDWEKLKIAEGEKLDYLAAREPVNGGKGLIKCSDIMLKVPSRLRYSRRITPPLLLHTEFILDLSRIPATSPAVCAFGTSSPLGGTSLIGSRNVAGLHEEELSFLKFWQALSAQDYPVMQDFLASLLNKPGTSAHCLSEKRSLLADRLGIPNIFGSGFKICLSQIIQPIPIYASNAKITDSVNSIAYYLAENIIQHVITAGKYGLIFLLQREDLYNSRIIDIISLDCGPGYDIGAIARIEKNIPIWIYKGKGRGLYNIIKSADESVIISCGQIWNKRRPRNISSLPFQWHRLPGFYIRARVRDITFINRLKLKARRTLISLKKSSPCSYFSKQNNSSGSSPVKDYVLITSKCGLISLDSIGASPSISTIITGWPDSFWARLTFSLQRLKSSLPLRWNTIWALSGIWSSVSGWLKRYLLNSAESVRCSSQKYSSFIIRDLLQKELAIYFPIFIQIFISISQGFTVVKGWHHRLFGLSAPMDGIAVSEVVSSI